jgi:capsular exopolysaccharide synthesis family protein
MSRIFDALQRSQGEDPDSRAATPAKSVAPEMPVSMLEEAGVQAPMVQTAVVQEPVADYTGAAHEPANPYATARVHAATAVQAPGDWLSVPPDRVLLPKPTPEQRLITLTNHNSQGAEMFRVLSTRLAHMKDKRQISRLLVSSAVGDEGKSIVAINLAVALAQRPGERVLLVEADLRRPTAATLLGASSPQGITEWHEGKVAIQSALYQIDDLPLWFLSAGKGVVEPLPVLESLEFANMLETVSAYFDWTILDSTPMLPMADAASLARLCDGVLVVVREGYTRRKVLNKALESIDRKKILGLVFNEAASQQMSYDRYYGGYGHYGRKKSNGVAVEEEEDKGKAATA